MGNVAHKKISKVEGLKNIKETLLKAEEKRTWYVENYYKQSVN